MVVFVIQGYCTVPQWVSCSLVRRRGGRNCFCVWRFLRTVICSVYQRGGVWIDCVRGVRGLQWFFLPVSWLWRCTGLGWWAGWHRWSFLQTWLSAGVYSYPVWWPIQTRQLLKCREQTRWLQCRTGSAAPEAGCTSWADAGSTSSVGPSWWWWWWWL